MTDKPEKFNKTAIIINLENGDILDKSIERLWKEPGTEIIVIDNHSGDSTKKVLDKWATPEHLPRFRAWRWNIIKGQSYNRNYGIKKAHGKYYLLLDSDILYYPGSFDYLINRLENAPKNIGCVGFNSYIMTNVLGEEPKELPSKDVPLDLNFPGQPIALTQYGVFQRSLFTRYKISFDEKYGTGYGWEDNDLALQMIQKGFQCAAVSFKYYHNRHTAHWWKLHDKDFMRLQERKRYFKDKWGIKAVQENPLLKDMKDYPDVVADKLINNYKPEDLKHISIEKQEKVSQYLEMLDAYRTKNPIKFEKKKAELINKLKNLIYGV